MSGAESTTETEIKIRVDDPARVRAVLERCGFRASTERLFEINDIYDRPSGDIHANGELLRIRRVGHRVIVTFKGKAEVATHKSREELEISVSDFATCDTIFRRIGFVQIFRYEKYRTEFRRQGENGVVTLDETPIGVYLEVEGSAAWIDTVAKELGYTVGDYVTSSYGTLYAQYCEASGTPEGDMVFR